NLFTLSASIDHGVLRAARFPDLPPFAQVGHAAVSLSLTDLFYGSYVVRTGHVTDADVHLVIDENGGSNVPIPPQTSASPSSANQTDTIDYLIEQVAFLSGGRQYDDRQKHIHAMLPVSSIRIVGDRVIRRHQVQLAAGGGGALVPGRHRHVHT